MSENQAVAHNAMETDDDRLAYTQGKRRQMIEQLMPEGKIPDDKGDKMVLLAALDGMDRVSINNKRIGAQEKQGAADRQAAVLIARLSKGMGNNSPFEREPIEGSGVRVAPTLDLAGLPELELVDGETHVGIATCSHEDFMRDTAKSDAASAADEP